MKKIHVTQTMDSYYPNIDGPTNVMTYYSKNINARDDATCNVIVPKAKKSLKYVDNQPFDVIRCNSLYATKDGYRMGIPFSDPEFKKRLKEEELDIMHAHSPFAMGHWTIREARRRGIPSVATSHTKFKEDFLRTFHGFKPIVWFMMKYIMYTFNRADSVWTVNDASCQILRDYGYKGDITVVRNGTDLKYPQNAEELIDRVNKAHNLEGQKNIFIFVGRIAFYKNLRLMAEALKILKKENDDFKLLIIGDGFDTEKFKVIISDLGLSDNVIFVGRISDRELLQGYYLRSDLFLFPSTYDTSSLVPIEAAAHKLPVLLIKDSCTAESITDDVNGFLAEETPEAFAERIKEIISDPEKMRKVGEEAHVSVYRTWEMVAEEAFEKYKEVIAKYNEKHGKKSIETENEKELINK